MPTTTTYEFGDVVVVPFPLSDYSNLTKKRPAVVISSKEYNAEAVVLSATNLDLIVVMAITSVEGGLAVLSIRKWRAAGLLHQSYIKPVIHTLTPDRVIDVLGKLQLSDKNQLKYHLLRLLNLTPSPSEPKQQP